MRHIAFVQIIAVIIGAWLTAGIIVGLGFSIYELIRDAYLRHEHQKKVDNRFGKKPIAKCYCIDCRYRADDFCIKTKMKVRLDDFCSKADSRDYKGGIEKT